MATNTPQAPVDFRGHAVHLTTFGVEKARGESGDAPNVDLPDSAYLLIGEDMARMAYCAFDHEGNILWQDPQQDPTAVTLAVQGALMLAAAEGLQADWDLQSERLANS